MMKKMLFIITSVLCLPVIATLSSPKAEDEMIDERRERLMQAARELRAQPRVETDGAVIQPNNVSVAPGEEESEIIIMFEDAQVRTVAQPYANFTGKEVFVSARVGGWNFDMERIVGNRSEIIDRIENALLEHGIMIVNAGSYSVAFVEKAECEPDGADNPCKRPETAKDL